MSSFKHFKSIKRLLLHVNLTIFKLKNDLYVYRCVSNYIWFSSLFENVYSIRSLLNYALKPSLFIYHDLEMRIKNK